MRVLVIDDDPGITMLLSEWFTAMGHEPSLITGGSHAATWLQNSHFDLVLTDIQMPDSDGLMMLPDMFEMGAKVVVMSGLPEDLWMGRAMMDGAYACLPKPVSFKKLEQILASLQP